MRLVCPNCGAQYEVDANVIPEAGRDVQCSNCGHTWYQRPQARPAAEPAMVEAAADAPSDEAGEIAAERPAEPERAREAEAVAAEPEANQDEDQDTAEPPPEQAIAPSKVDPAVSDILKEEAALEQAARDAERAPEPSALETQSELGLDSGGETAPNVHERMARLRELDDELGVTAAAAAVPGNRKDLLPDIEEINSSLTPDDDADRDEVAPEVAAEQSRRSGFRRGFALAILVFAVMTLVYLFAPRIVTMNPASEPALAAYVDWVNGTRSGLNGFMASAAERLTALLASMNSQG